jgi:hypothetical protein
VWAGLEGLFEVHPLSSGGSGLARGPGLGAGSNATDVNSRLFVSSGTMMHGFSSSGGGEIVSAVNEREV